MGGLWLRGPRAQQRGWAQGAPGGALQWGHWAGVQGGQAPGHCWWPPGSSGGQDCSGREGLGGLCGSRGGRLPRPLPAPQQLLQLLRLGPPQVGQGPASLEGGQEGLQALLPQQQLLHLLLGQGGRDSLGGPRPKAQGWFIQPHPECLPITTPAPVGDGALSSSLACPSLSDCGPSPFLSSLDFLTITRPAGAGTRGSRDGDTPEVHRCPSPPGQGPPPPPLHTLSTVLPPTMLGLPQLLWPQPKLPGDSHRKPGESHRWGRWACVQCGQQFSRPSQGLGTQGRLPGRGALTPAM